MKSQKRKMRTEGVVYLSLLMELRGRMKDTVNTVVNTNDVVQTFEQVMRPYGNSTSEITPTPRFIAVLEEVCRMREWTMATLRAERDESLGAKNSSRLVPQVLRAVRWTRAARSLGSLRGGGRETPQVLGPHAPRGPHQPRAVL